MSGKRDAYAGLLGDCESLAYEDRPLADLVNPLVITDTGWLKPIAYDFESRFNISRLDTLSSDSLHRYKKKHLSGFQELIGGALAGLQARHDLVDWFDHCTRLSEQQSQ